MITGNNMGVRKNRLLNEIVQFDQNIEVLRTQCYIFVISATLLNLQFPEKFSCALYFTKSSVFQNQQSKPII